MRRMITDKLTKNIKEIVAAYQAGEIGAKVEVANITAIDGAILTDLKAGDIVVKKTGDMRHTYVVTYKEENKGICMSYIDASVAETVSYDYVTNAWVYNSTDVTTLGGTEVVANPTLAGTEANLTGLQVGDTKYAVPQGGSGSQLYAHTLLITYSDTTSGDNLVGTAYFISPDDTAITKDNIITKLIAAGYDSSAKRITFSGTIYVATDTKFCGLTYLARNTNSNTNLRVGFAGQATADAVTNASIQIDTSNTEITFLVTDTVITL